MRTWEKAYGRRSSIVAPIVLAVSAAVGGIAPLAHAADGTWTNPVGNDWNLATTTNWLNGIVADGAGATANFNTVDLNNDIGVNLTEDRTIGTLNFGDTDPVNTAGGWLMTGNPLTLSGPSIINVGALALDRNVNFTNVLKTTTGFTKTGAGTLVLSANNNDAGNPGFTGGINLNEGALSINGAINTTNVITLAAGTTLNVGTSIGQNAATGGRVVLPAGQAYTINMTNGAGAFLANVGGLGSTLTLNLNNIQVSADRNWAINGAMARVNVVGTNVSGPGSFRLRINGGAFGGFDNTELHIDNTNVFTNTNSGGNNVLFGALSGTSTAQLSGGAAGTAAHYLIGALNTNTEFAGSIATGTGLNLVKQGTGTLTLSSNIAAQPADPATGFIPATVIAQGGVAYQPTANTIIGRRGGFTVVAGGTLKLTNQAVIPGGIDADGLPETTGDNVDAVIDVRAGATLDVSGLTNPASTQLRQRLVGKGTVAGNWTHAQGHIAPGNNAGSATFNLFDNTVRETTAAGTLTFSNQLAISGGQIDFDISPSISSGNDQIVAGSANLSGNTTLKIGFLGGASSGNYPLITAAGGVTGSTAGWNVLWEGRGAAPALVQTATQVLLNLSSITSGNLVWSGTASDVWSAGASSPLNWYNGGTAAQDSFFQLDNVSFLNTYDGVNGPANTTATLNTTVSPQSVTVNANFDYTIQGTGSIAGGASLVKSGTGTLNLYTPNTFNGTVTINGGRIDLGQTGSIGSGPLLTFNGGELHRPGGDLNQAVVVNAATNNALRVTSASTLTVRGAMSGSGNIIFGNALGTPIGVDLAADNSAFTGSITVGDPGATLVTRLINPLASNASIAWTISNDSNLGSKVDGIATTHRLGSLAGGSTSVLDGHGSSLGAADVTWEIGALNTSTTFSGVVRNGNQASGANTTGITKVGTGTLTLDGTLFTAVVDPNDPNLTIDVPTYTGATTVKAGTLVLGNNATMPVLAGAGGADVQGGRLVLDYTGGSSPSATVLPLLQAAFANSFLTGQIRNTTATGAIGLGYIDDAGTSQYTIAEALYGDTDLSGSVNFDDLLKLAQNYNGTTKVWSDGDSTYDGLVNFDDLLKLAQNYNGSLLAAEQLVGSMGDSFSADWTLAMSLVPEPTSLAALLGFSGIAIRRRRAE